MADGDGEHHILLDDNLDASFLCFMSSCVVQSTILSIFADKSEKTLERNLQ